MNESSSHDEYIEDSQHVVLPQDYTNKTKTIVSKEYETKMRSLLLNKSKKPHSIQKLRNILLDKRHDEEDDDVFIGDSQDEPEIGDKGNKTPLPENITNTNVDENNDEYLHYLADHYTKDVTSQDKGIIGGHLLRKRNLNQLHIYELDRLNYEKITAKMADARYEQSDHGDEFEDQDSIYSSKSIEESQVYQYEDSFDNNDLDFFNSINDTTGRNNSNAKVSKNISVFEDSDDSELIELSSDSDDYIEIAENIKEERILPNNKRGISTMNNPKKKSKQYKENEVKVNKRNPWGSLKKVRKVNVEKRHNSNIDSKAFSSSDSDDGLDDFLKDFKKNVTITNKQPTNKEMLSKVLKQPTRVRKMINKGVANKNIDEDNIKPNRRQRKKNINTMDNFFQAHLEVDAANYENYIDLDDIEVNVDESVIEIKKDGLVADDISSYFLKRHKDIGKRTSQSKFKSSNIYKRLMGSDNEEHIDIATTDFKITLEQLGTLKLSLMSVLDNQDYTPFLDYLYTSPNINITLVMQFFEQVAIEARPVLVSLGNKKTSEQMTSVFYKTVCIPLLGFHSLINNTYLDLSKKESISKMSNFIVRSLNNLFKLQSCYNDATEYYDAFTKHILIKTLASYPKEYKKIVQYYNNKGPSFMKYSYPTLFKDLRVIVNIETCLDMVECIDDLDVKKVFLGSCFLSYEEDNVTKHELMKCLEIFSSNIYNQSPTEYAFDENFIFSLRSDYRINLKFTKNNATLLLFRILLKYSKFFVEDSTLNAEVVYMLKPKYNGKQENFSQRLQKINMCSVLFCLHVNNFIILIDDFLKLLNTKELEKKQLISYYKKPSIRNEILKDAFDQCLKLHNIMRLSISNEWVKGFYKNIPHQLWDSFYNLEWNLLGEKLINKYSIQLFVDFISKLYFRNKSEMIEPIKEILKNSIEVDDTVSLIYQFCMKTVLDDPFVSPQFIKTNIYGKLFMFFKVCDSVKTYSKVIEKAQSILNNEVLDYKGYRTFFKKSGDEISPIDFYYSISSIKISKDSMISTGLKIKIFAFIKSIILRWISNPSYFKQKDGETICGMSFSEKCIEVWKNYIIMTKNLLVVTTTVVETIKALFVECNFNDFVELINDIRALGREDVTIQLQRLFNDIDLPFNKSSYSYFVDLLIKHNIKEKKHVLKEYLNGIKVSKDLSIYINEICQNEIGFENLVVYLLRHDVHTFAQVYKTLKMPQALLRVEKTLIKFLKDKCLNITIDQWDTITALPSNNQELLFLKHIMVKHTKKEKGY